MIDCLIDGSDFVVMVAADIVLCFDGDRLRRRKVAVSVGKRTTPRQRATGRQVDGAIASLFHLKAAEMRPLWERGMAALYLLSPRKLMSSRNPDHATTETHLHPSQNP